MKKPRLRVLMLLAVLMTAALLVVHRRLAPPAASSAVPNGAPAPAANLPPPTPGAAESSEKTVEPPARPQASVTGTTEDTRSAFTDWLTAWRRADAAARPALAAAGRELAVARRAALKQLIVSHPRLALELAVPPGLRAELPFEVAAQLERTVDARGDFEVTLACLGAVTRLDRAVIIEGRRLEAFVYGRRERQTTKFGLPVHGIAIDDVLAFAETPYRVLDDTEKAARGIAGDQIGVLVGGTVFEIGTQAECEALQARLVSAESQPGPWISEAMSGVAAPPLPATAALTSPPSWINGTKRVLWIKIDFADEPGAAFTDAAIQEGSAGATDYYSAISQNKTTFTWTILPAVLRMPKDKAYYSTSGSTNSELYTAARDAAKAYDVANGGTGAWDPEKFDRYLILHTRISVYLYSGVAQIGGPRVGLNNTISAGTIAHELGHSQSLYHSHHWLPTGTSAMGAGSHVEYGDVFDRMGSGSITQHFNVAQKYKLGYLDNESVITVAQTGTYRIARHDDKDAAGMRGLRLAPADLGYEYWIEYHRAGNASNTAAQLDRLRNGVLVHWGTEKAPKFTSGPGTYLLDATPGSTGGANDSGLRIGERIVDADAGITVKPLAVGGAAPNEYIDVQVSFGAIDGNRDPILAADAPAGPITARSNVVFNARATDPDGDPVYFRWDFGDGSLQPNLDSITRRFSKGGAYTLRVSAHDGKGGIATRSFSLAVADPLLTWTRAITNLTNNLYGAIYAGGRFVVVGDSGATLTSTDGLAWTRGNIPSTSHFYRGIAHNGSRFATVGIGASNASVRATAAYSDDGLAWTAAAVPAGAGQMNAAAFGVGRFVAVGETGRIYNSVDAATWSEVSSPVSNTLRAIAYADNLFVASGDSGRIVTSVDGVNWANRSVATSNTLFAVARHKDRWWASSATAECFSSTDGATWTRVATAGRTSNTQRMISTSGVLLTSTAGGGIAFTEDPRAWATTQIDATANTTFYGLAEGAGRIVVVGSRGLAYSTVVVPASPVLPAPSLRFEADTLKVAVGKKNVLGVSGPGFARIELYANGTKVSETAGPAGALTWTPPIVGNYSLVVRGVEASGASVASAVYPAVAAFAHWRWRNPMPVGSDLRGAVRVGDKWWIVGGGGALLTLDDAGNFAEVDFSTTQQLNAIAQANGRFVIATTDLDGATKEDIGGVWTSSDGHAWQPFLTGALDSANLNYVLYAADRWIGLATGGTIVTSTDGVNWPRAPSGITQSIYSAVAGNGVIVAVAAGGRIITSTTGLTWTERSSGVTTDLRAITFKEGGFVAAGLSGVILTSSDGTTWTRATSGTTANLYGAGVVQDVFVVGGDNGTLLTSADGTSWTVTSPDGNFSGNLFVGSSAGKGLLLGRAGEVYTGVPQSGWKRLTMGTGEARQGVIYAGGRFVAVGARTDPITRATVVPIQYSTDGITWTRATDNAAFNNLNAIAYGQQRYVAVGANSSVFTSADAIDWTQGAFTVSSTLTAVAAGPNGFVAASSGQSIYSSPDGTRWTQRVTGVGAALRAAAYGNDRFVVVGDGGTIRHSPDGAAWAAATSGTTANLLKVAWFEDFGFIAVGNSGTMITSTDGITWRTIETGVSDNLTAIARTPLGFVAAGGTTGTLIVSLDGQSWSISALPADKTIRSLAASSSAIVAAGDNGALLTFELVDSTPPPAILAPPVSRLGVEGETVTFSVTAQNAAGAVYQWLKDGVPIAGANLPVYTIPNVTAARGGSYTVTITTPTGQATSSPAVLSFGAAADPARLVNLSILTSLTSAVDSFIFGVVIGGTGTSGGKALLVRAVGPSLTPLGVSDAVDDPKIEFFTGAAKIGENDNWGGAPAVSTAMAQVGAFPFIGLTSRDAALALPSLASGANSAKISGTGAGAVLAELYDATPASGFTTSTPRLVNVSVLKHLGSGVTAGFVVGGSNSRTVLVRAIGPTLAGFGITEAVPDPQLALFRGATQIGANDDWGGTSALTAAFAQVGAFPLANNSKDAALLAPVPAGNYTVQVKGVGGATGVALVEIYEVP